MSDINRNRRELSREKASNIDCIKLAHAGEKKLMLVACLTDGRRLQLTNPHFELLINDCLAEKFVKKFLSPEAGAKFVSVAGGNVCINQDNVKSFGSEGFGHHEMVNISAQFESGNDVRLFSVPAIEQEHEKERLSAKFFGGEME